MRVRIPQIARRSPFGLILQAVATAHLEDLVGVRSDRRTTSLSAKALNRAAGMAAGAPFKTKMPTRISAPAILLAVSRHARSLAAGP